MRAQSPSRGRDRDREKQERRRQGETEMRERDGDKEPQAELWSLVQLRKEETQQELKRGSVRWDLISVRRAGR